MPDSFSSIYLHAIFSTKNRQPFLADAEMRRELYAYMAGVSANLDCPAVAIGGVEDHAHALVRFGKKIAVADWIKELKRVSSVHVKEQIPGFAWQAGYGVFSVEAASVAEVAAYIRDQENHHRTTGYKDEFRWFLRENLITWDERYVWD